MAKRVVLCVVFLIFWLAIPTVQSQDRPQEWEQVKVFTVASPDATAAATQLTAQINEWFRNNEGIRVVRREMQTRTVPSNNSEGPIYFITVIVHFWYLHS